LPANKMKGLGQPGASKPESLASQDLVFVDETGAHIAMTPLYAYAPRGQRAKGSVPRNYGANITLLASLSRQGMGEAFILQRCVKRMSPFITACFLQARYSRSG
jgi:hypothetical protein